MFHHFCFSISTYFFILTSFYSDEMYFVHYLFYCSFRIFLYINVLVKFISLNTHIIILLFSLLYIIVLEMNFVSLTKFLIEEFSSKLEKSFRFNILIIPQAVSIRPSSFYCLIFSIENTISSIKEAYR